MAAAATVAAMMLLLAAVISAKEQCSNDKPEFGGGQTHLHEVSSRLRHVVAPPPFPPFLVRSTNELSPPNHQFSGILRRLKQVPCRGISLATFGGSVTWGSQLEYLMDNIDASRHEAWEAIQKEKTWGGHLTRYLNEAFPCEHHPHTHVNYGIGGSGVAPVALAFHMLGFDDVTSETSSAPDLVLGEFAVNDDFWGWTHMQQTCSSSSSTSVNRHKCTLLDSLFTESFVRNFRLLGSAVAFLRFGYSFVNNDAGEIHAPVLKHYGIPSWNLKTALLHPNSSVDLNEVWPLTRGHPPLEGHILIAKYVASQLADVFEELESFDQQHQRQQQQQQQQQQQHIPAPYFFKSAEAASMKGICLIDFTKFADRENGARLALEKRGGGGGSADYSNHATLFLCSLSSKAWSLEEDVAHKRGCIGRTPEEPLLLPVNSSEGIVYLSYLCTSQGVGAARVAVYRLESSSPAATLVSATLVSSTYVDALSSHCFNHKTISLSDSLSASPSHSHHHPSSKQFPNVYSTLGNVIIEIVLQSAEKNIDGKILHEGRQEKFKVLSVAAM